jgi:hypothetical protein
VLFIAAWTTLGVYHEGSAARNVVSKSLIRGRRRGSETIVRCMSSSSDTLLVVQLLVVPKYAIRVRQAPVAGQVCLEGAVRQLLLERQDPVDGAAARELLHAVWKGEVQAVDDLEEDEVGVGHFVADEQA